MCRADRYPHPSPSPCTLCNHVVAIFMVVQTCASMNVSIAALLLLVAACRLRPFRWSLCSGTFFMVYAILQGVAVGLVVAVGRKLEDGESAIRNVRL